MHPYGKRNHMIFLNLDFMGDEVKPLCSSVAQLLLQAAQEGGAWGALRQDAQPHPSDLAAVLACPRTDAAFRTLLRVVRTPAECHTVRKTLREKEVGGGSPPAGTGAGGAGGEVSATLLAQRARQIAELTALRQELAACQSEIRERQASAEARLHEREELTRGCDLARRQQIHLQGYRCKMKRAARVLRGSASQLELHGEHGTPGDSAVRDAVRRHLLELVRRTIAAEGTLIDESIRFLRSSGATVQGLAAALGELLADSTSQLKGRREGQNTGAAAPEERRVGGSDDPAATRKMRALLTLAHGQHLAAYEEVEVLRIQAHESRARAEELSAEVEKQLSKQSMSDSEWRVTTISMKQDRDLAAARASLLAVQGRLNDMKIKVQMGKETSDRLEDQRSRLRALQGDIREAKQRSAGLTADIRRLLKLVHERNGGMARFCEAEIVRSGPALQEASELTRRALLQHSLQHSLAMLPAVKRRGDKPADLRGQHSGWPMVAQAAILALKLPNATSEHAVLQSIAAAVQREARVAAQISFGTAKKEAMLERASTSSWNSVTTMANLRASHDANNSVSASRARSPPPFHSLSLTFFCANLNVLEFPDGKRTHVW